MQVLDDGIEMLLHPTHPRLVLLRDAAVLAVIIGVIDGESEVIAESMHRLIERATIALHDEVDDVAVRSAGETVETISVWEKRERLRIIAAVDEALAAVRAIGTRLCIADVFDDRL